MITPPYASKPPVGRRLAAGAPLAAALLGFYPLNESSGTYAYDLGPMSQNVLLTAPSWNASSIGSGLGGASTSFSGSSTLPTSYLASWPMTVAAYVITVPGQTPTSGQVIFGVMGNTGNSVCVVGLGASNHARAAYESGTSYTAFASPVASAIATGTAFVFSISASGTATIYSEGIARASAAISQPTGNLPGSIVRIGNTGDTFGMTCLWAAWWSRCLAPTEIAYISSSPNAIWSAFGSSLNEAALFRQSSFSPWLYGDPSCEVYG